MKCLVKEFDGTGWWECLEGHKFHVDASTKENLCFDDRVKRLVPKCPECGAREYPLSQINHEIKINLVRNATRWCSNILAEVLSNYADAVPEGQESLRQAIRALQESERYYR